MALPLLGLAGKPGDRERASRLASPPWPAPREKGTYAKHPSIIVVGNTDVEDLWAKYSPGRTA
jgi:hypothetical protein